MATIDLNNFFLIRKVNGNYLEHSNNEISLGFRLNHLPYGVTSPKTQKAVFEFINKLLRHFPDGTWIQKQDFFWERTVLPDSQKHYSAISRENYKYYSFRETLGHASFLFITYLPEPFRNYYLRDSPFVRMVKQAFVPDKGKSDVQRKAFIKQTIEELKKGTNGFAGEVLKENDWEKLFYSYYSGDYNFDNNTVPEVLDLGNYNQTDEGYLQRENFLFANVFMGKEPQELVDLWGKYKVVSANKKDNFVYLPNEEIDNYAAFPITAGLPFSHCTTVTIQKAENEAVINELNRQTKLNRFGLGGSDSKFNPDNKNVEEKESQKAHAQELKEFITNSPFPACTYGVSVTIPGFDKQSLSERVEMAKSAFAQYAAKGEFNRAHNMPNFFSSAPAHGHNGHDFLLGQTVNALPFFNINSYPKGDNSGILYTDPTTGYPISFNPWDNPLLAGVRNGYTTGPTRGGKSVKVATECDYYHSNGFHQVIIEKGRSFEWVTLIYEGDYIDLHPGGEIGINLFDYNPKKLSELQKSLIVSVLSKIYPGRDQKIIAGVTNILEQYNIELKESGGKPSIEGYFNYFTTQYMKGESFYSKHMDFQLYAAELERFVTGANRWLFNNTNNVDINKRPFVVFELKALEGSPLFSLAVEAVLGLINRKMEYWDRAIRLVIKIDEALQPFEDENSSGLLKEFYTQVGKFNAGIDIMVQSIGLIKKLPAWDAVEANTQLRTFTYNQHLDGWAETEARLLGWSSYRLKLLKNLRDTPTMREMLIIAGEEEIVVGLSLSPIANYAFSTTAEVRNKIKKLQEENPNRGIKELIFEEYYRNKKMV